MSSLVHDFRVNTLILMFSDAEIIVALYLSWNFSFFGLFLTKCEMIRLPIIDVPNRPL